MKDNWGNKPVTFAVWDFAGQEVYYSTHQFYLSRRSLYLCVFDLTDPDITSVTPPPTTPFVLFLSSFSFFGASRRE